MKKKILLEFIKRVDKELPNFKHIVNNLPYKSTLHQKAVEVYSFELLEKEVSNLQTLKKFRKDSTKIKKLIQERDVNKLIENLELIKLKINKYFTNHKNESNEEIFNLKPSFYGFGINLKALWRKFKEWIKNR